jgi:hypothetical protein
MLTESCSEKYMKKLIGRTEIDDGLKRLDELTHEEARMAVAQTLKLTLTVVAIDDWVASVYDRLASVGGQMAGVTDRVASVSGSSQMAGVTD